MNPSNSNFNRPGVTDTFLATAGCHHIDENDCVRQYGFKAAGIAIPFRDMHGEPIMEGGKPFCRVRLYEGTDDQKYNQRPGSGVHIFIPPNFSDRLKGSTVILVEGEFKALALAEAGYCALGLCGIHGAAHTVEQGGERRCELRDELVQLLKAHQPATIVFAGDADVVLNSYFAAEAAKLRRLICGSKQLGLAEKVLTIKPPIDGPKGFDDCRAAQGAAFNPWFDELLAHAIELEAKATSVEIFCALLRREKTAAQKLLAEQTGDAHRLRVKLLSSAAHLQHEVAAMLSLRPILAEVLGVKESEVTGLIRDADKSMKEKKQNENHQNGVKIQGAALKFSEIEPWPSPVSGAEILAAVSLTMGQYVSLPSGAADVSALWCAHSHLIECFTCSPRLNFSSPEKGCGKTTARDVVGLFVPRPLLAENMTSAVLFRVIEQYRATMLADEADAWLRDNEELRGLLNAGHRRGGQALRCEGEKMEVRAFNVFAPVVICGIGELPGTLHDRSISIRLQRANYGEVPRRFDSRDTGREVELARKLVRWCLDHKDEITACDPVLPPGVFNRLADNWRPLFAIAEIAGGEWPTRIVDAFASFANTKNLDAAGLSEMLLADIHTAFTENGVDRMFSKALIKSLLDMNDRPWLEANNGRPITENWLARRLRQFGIQSGSMRVGEDNAKGYYLTNLSPVFSRYLSGGHSIRHNVTLPANAGQNSLLEASQQKPCDVSESVVSVNKELSCDGVTAPNSESEALLL